MSLNNKFSFLKNFLKTNNYDFITNISISEIFDSVFEFFTNRTKWNLLRKAKDRIQKLNLEIKININEDDNYIIIDKSADSQNIKV
jgi:hypothetical protein